MKSTFTILRLSEYVASRTMTNSLKKTKTTLLLFAVFLMGCNVNLGQTTVFSDSFGTSAGSTYTTTAAIGTSSTWSFARLGADWGARINGGVMDLTNDAGATANIAGWGYGYTPVSNFTAPYNSTLSSNSGPVTWTFNMKTNRTTVLAGFGSTTSYGAAVVLASTSTSVGTTGTGYAVLMGGGANNNLGLYYFSGGLQGTRTAVVAYSNPAPAALTDYMSVKVVYTPSTNTWAISTRADGSTAADPAAGTLTSLGSAVNSTGTSTAMPNFGFYWQGSTGATQSSLMDNVKVTVTEAVACTPQTISALATPVTKSFGETHSIFTTASSGLTVTYSSSNNSVASVDSSGNVSINGIGGPITLTAAQAGNGTYCAATSVTQSLTVIKATPTITTSPTATAITYGQTLASSNLSGGTANVTGTFAFTAPATAPAAGTALYSVTFTPDDATYYNTATGTASVLVNPKALTITANDVTKPEGTTITGGSGSTAFTSSGLLSGETIDTVTITYGAGADSADSAGSYPGSVVASDATGGSFNASNYTITYLPGTITVSAGALITGSATTTPTFVSATYGTVSGEASFTVSGNNMAEGILVTPPNTNFEVSLTSGGTFTDTVTVGGAGTIPTTTVYIRLKDTAPVNTYSGNITLTSDGASAVSVAIASSTVSKATPTIITSPTAATITYGQTLQDATLSGGSASVAGSFAFTTPATIPPGGTALYSVTFTPTDTTNYNNAIGTASVTVNQASSSISATGLQTFTYTGSPQGPDTSTVTGSTGAVTYTYSGVSPTSYGPSTTKPTVVGTYKVVAEVAADTNYLAATSADYTFDITKANQVITGLPLTDTRVLGAASYNLTATAPGGAVTYSIDSPSSVASVTSGGIVTIGTVGVTTITASQTGDSNYNAAPNVQQTLTVSYPVIAGWDFTGIGSVTNTTVAATTFNSNLVSSSGGSNISRGAGAAWSNAANSYRTTGFQNNGISTSNTDYFQTTLTPSTGNILSIATITANLAGTSSFTVSPGVSSQFAYSLNGTTFTLIGSPTITIGTPASLTIDVSGVSALQNVPAGTTVTFRYYASGQTTTGGWGFQSGTSAGTNGLAFTGLITKVPPTVTTNTATVVSSTSAVLNGTVNANGNDTTASFDYGTVVIATTPVSGAVTGTTNTATSATISGLSVNTQYIYKAVASGGTGGTTNGGNVSFFTFANTPTAPVLTNATETSIDVTIGSGDGNPSETLYAIQLNNGSYVQIGGATLGVAVWQTANAWGTTTVSNLNCGASSSFTVYAKNGDGVTTSGTSASLSTAACTNPSLQADSLPAFNGVCINTSSTSSFGLLGLNLTSAVTVNTLEGFTFSTDDITYSPSLLLTPVDGEILETIYVKFTPTAVQSYSSSISITGGGTSGITVEVTASGINTPATVTTGSATVSSTEAVVAGTSTVICGPITTGIEYSVNSDFSGSSQSTGAFPVTLGGLSPNTTYYYKAFATAGAVTVYGLDQSFTTSVIGTPNVNAASDITCNSFKANWGSVPAATEYRLDVTTSTIPYATDLFFSEYVEGSSNNKYIEIYNGTGSTVNLSDYQVLLFTNGAASASNTENLTGTLAHGATLVFRNSGASIVGTTGYATSLVTNFNGDDAIALKKISTDSYVDIFGRIGNDPGTAWTSTSNTTVDRTLTRKPTVISGITTSPTGTGASAFTTLESEWTVSAAIDSVSGLGSHTFTPATVTSFVPGYQNLMVEAVAGEFQSQVVTGLTSGITYQYNVRAVSANSTSVSSSPVSVTTTVEINFNSIDDDCDTNLYNGHAPVVVDITTPSGALATMSSTITSSTATNTTPYSGASVTYKFKVTKTNAPTSVAYVSSNTTSFSFSSASNAAHSSTYDVQATAIVNGEEQPYNGNTESYTTPAAPTISNPPTQAGPSSVACAYTIARIDSYIYANNSTTYGATRYEFLVERMDNGNPVQTVSVATTVPYFKLTNIAGIPTTMQVTYGTTYRISVRYGYGATSFGSQIYTAYGSSCLVSTPSLPIASIACGTSLASINAFVYASGQAAAASQFEFKVTRVSPQQPGELPITVTEEILPRNVANFKLTMLTQLFVGLQKEYSVSVRYTVNAYGSTNVSSWSPVACSLFTPDFPETQIIEAQCGVEGVPSTVNEYVYADGVPGATQYQFRLFNSVDLPYTEENPYDYTVYSPNNYVKLNQFPGLVSGIDYSVTVVAQLNGEYPNIALAKDCSITAPASTPTGPAKVVTDVFKATAYPNPFANNFMIAVKSGSQSAVDIKVYDMIGRLIESRKVTLSDMETTTIGGQYPSGVYNVVVSQDDELQTIRVVKR